MNNVVRILDNTIEWTLYALVFSIPFSKSIIEICITVAFLAWVFKKLLLKNFTLEKTPLNLFLAAFVIANLISFVNADFKLLFMRSMVSKCLKFAILYFIIVETVKSEAIFKNLLKWAAISAAIVMVDSFLQYFLTHYDLIRFYPTFKYAPMTDPRPYFLGYPTGPFPFPNDLAAWMLVLSMPLLTLFTWGAKKINEKIVPGLLLAPFLYLFYLTNARSAWLGFFVAFFSIVFIKSKKAFIVLLVIVVLALSVIPLFSSRQKIDDLTGLSSIQDRFYMWRISWRIFTEHPVIGNGLNMFFTKFMEYRDDSFRGLRGSYAHNGFLQIAAETGIIGLTVFLLLLIRVFKSALGFMRKSGSAYSGSLCLGLAGGLLAFLIHSFFDTNLQSLPLVTLFWVNIALIMSLEKIYAREI